MESKKGDRNLSVLEFFKELQREYFVAEIRSKIYPRLKDKTYFKERVMRGKKNVIEDIAKKNNLVSIFSNQEEYDKFRLEIYGERGKPKFQYKNKKIRLEFEEKDNLYYYYIKSEVRVFSKEENREDLGKIKFVNLNADLIEVELENENIIVTNLNNVTRIL